MVVSGLPLLNNNRHVSEIASLALHLLDRVRKLEISHRPGELLQIRIGIHSGHCAAGVVGVKVIFLKCYSIYNIYYIYFN